MKKVLTFLMLTGCVLMLSSCVTAPTGETKETEVVINSSFDKVWNATISYLIHGGYEIKTQDKASGLINVRFQYYGSGVYDKAKELVVRMPPVLFASWTSYGSEFQMFISAKASNVTSMYIRTADMFVYRAARGNEIMPELYSGLSSTGVMESRIISSIKQSLGLPVDVSTATSTTAK